MNTTKKGRVTQADAMIGQRLQLLREHRGIPRKVLGSLIEVSYQQIQKYEIGENRISAYRLYQFSQLLEAPLEYFFADENTKQNMISSINFDCTVIELWDKLPTSQVKFGLYTLLQALQDVVKASPQDNNAQ